MNNDFNAVNTNKDILWNICINQSAFNWYNNLKHHLFPYQMIELDMGPSMGHKNNKIEVNGRASALCTFKKNVFYAR